MENSHSMTRRAFINRTALGVAAVALTPFNSLIAANPQSTWAKNASKYNMIMIGHGHIDPVWLWRWQEGVAVVHSTFRSALDRMKENPDMCFTASSAQFYQWVADNDPDMLKEIRQRVDEGRWNIVGGWWVEPDVNVPCGESLVRQGLYGQLTFQRLFNKRAKVAFNPDSFGHPGTLPQIIAKQGMDNYCFMRPAAHEKTIPADLFWWEAPDGTRVMTYRIQNSYGDGGDSVRRNMDAILKIAPQQPMNTFMAFYGVGDHGGGPTKENLKSIEEIRKDKNAPHVTYGGLDTYFEKMRANTALSLPNVKDDLQHHSVGCYTAEGILKKGNSLAEEALMKAEKLCTIGQYAWKAAYPKADFTTAWQKLLFMQFHDSMAGTALVSHYKMDVTEAHGFAISTAHDAEALAIQKLEWHIPTTDKEAQYMVVFNPHAWEVKADIHYDLSWNEKPENSSVVDSNGKALPHQWVLGESQCGDRKGLVFEATLPPMGYEQFRVIKGTPFNPNSPVKAESSTLENEFYKITFATDGTIGIFDKSIGKELFPDGKGGCRAIVINDTSDTWSHDIKSYEDEVGAFGNASMKVLENGPLRAVMRVISTYEKSTLTIDWCLYTGSKHIDADVTLDWHEHLKILKFSFPANIDSPVSTYEVPYGFIQREANGYENPGQHWIDITGSVASAAYGLAVINDSKYGYDVKGNDMRVSVARSAVYAQHNPAKLYPDKEYIWQDQGIQSFRMAVVPHKGSWQDANIPRISEEFLSQPVTLYQGIHQGHLPLKASFLSIDVPNVNISSIKKAEEGDDIIIRLVETCGKMTDASVDFVTEGGSWNLSFKPCEIKTLRCNASQQSIKEVNLLEE